MPLVAAVTVVLVVAVSVAAAVVVVPSADGGSADVGCELAS